MRMILLVVVILLCNKAEADNKTTLTQREERLQRVEGAGGDVEGELDKEQILRRQLLKEYDKNLRPSANNLTVLLTSLALTDMRVDEIRHSLVMSGTLDMTWEDRRLKWRLEDHEELDRLGMDPRDIWTPDLAIPSPAPSSAASPAAMRSQLPSLVYPNGEVWVALAVEMELECLSDLTLWPRDTLNCSITLGSWLHQGHMLNLSLTHQVLQVTVRRGEWSVVEGNISLVEQHHPCCVEPRVFIMLSILLHRNAPTFTTMLKTPVICVMILTCLMFVVPPSGGEKILLGGFSLILHLLHLAIINYLLPSDPHTTPLLISAVVNQMVVVVACMVVSVVVVRTARPPHSYPLPSYIKTLLISASPILCLSTYSFTVKRRREDYAIIMKCEDEAGDGGGEGGRSEYQPQWLLLAATLERLAFVLYIFVCVGSLIRLCSLL